MGNPCHPPIGMRCTTTCNWRFRVKRYAGPPRPWPSMPSLLALEMEHGTLNDRGGPDALRLFASVVRATLGRLRPGRPRLTC